MINIFERPYQICFSKNPIRYGFSTDADTSQSGFIIEIRLMWRMLHSGTDFAEMLTIPLTPNSDKIAYANLRSLIDSRVEFYTPEIDNINFEFCEGQCVEFYVDYREIWEGQENTEWTDGSENISVAMKGGLSYEKWTGPNYFVSYLNTNKDFLTWKREQHYIQPEQKTFLFYLHTGNADTINLKITIHYTDGTTNAANYLTQVAPVKYGVYSCPTGVKQLGLDTVSATKVIHYYDIEIINAGGTLAGVYRYWVDYRIFSTAKFGQLSYRNSLGGMESIVILGNIAPTMKYEFESAERTTEGGYYDLDHLQPQRLQLEGMEKRTYKANVGFLFLQEQDRLREAAIRRELYYLKGAQWLPVILLSDDLAMSKNEDMLYVAEIEFQFAFYNMNYTPDGVEVGDLPACPIPQNLSIASITNKVITLNWTATGTEVGFVIEAKGHIKYTIPPTPWDPDGREGVNFADWKVIGSATTSPFQYDATEWADITFRVRANCAISQSGYSNEVTANP